MPPSSLPVRFTVNGDAFSPTTAIGFAGAVITGTLFGGGQVCVVAPVRGARPAAVVATVKSLKLLFVSWQPALLRSGPDDALMAVPSLTDCPPSPLFDVPYATRSRMRESGSVHGVAVAPQPRAVPVVAKATLPEVPDMFSVAPPSMSVVVGRPEPAVPNLTERYAC